MSIFFVFDKGSTTDFDTFHAEHGFKFDGNNFSIVNNVFVTYSPEYYSNVNYYKNSTSTYKSLISSYSNFDFRDTPYGVFKYYSTYYLPFNTIAYYIKSFARSSFLTSDYLSNDFKINGFKIGARLKLQNIVFTHNDDEGIGHFFTSSGPLNVQVLGHIEHRDNAYIFYLPYKYYVDSYTWEHIKTEFRVFALLKSNKIEETNCCLLAMCEPTKYKYVGA